MDPEVAGSIPVTHPIFLLSFQCLDRFSPLGFTRGATVALWWPYQAVHFQHRISFQFLNPVAIGIHRQLDAGMSHLLLDVDDIGPVFNQAGRKRVPRG